MISQSLGTISRDFIAVFLCQKYEQIRACSVH
jgi:hypothetical protein